MVCVRAYNFARGNLEHLNKALSLLLTNAVFKRNQLKVITHKSQHISKCMLLGMTWYSSVEKMSLGNETRMTQ